jgi:hypothetical protein
MPYAESPACRKRGSGPFVDFYEMDREVLRIELTPQFWSSVVMLQVVRSSVRHACMQQDKHDGKMVSREAEQGDPKER